MDYLIVFGEIILFFSIIYVARRVKNSATIKDLEDMTKIVEQVKDEFTKENAKINAQLSLLNQHKFSLANEKRNAILDYLDAVTNRVRLINQASPYNLDSVDKRDESFSLVETTGKRLDLFIEGEEFLNFRTKLIEIFYEQEKICNKAIKDMHDVDSVFTKMDYQAKIDKKNEISKKFRKDNLEFYKSTTLDKEREMYEYLRGALFEILKEKTI